MPPVDILSFNIRSHAATNERWMNGFVWEGREAGLIVWRMEFSTATATGVSLDCDTVRRSDEVISYDEAVHKVHLIKRT